MGRTQRICRAVLVALAIGLAGTASASAMSFTIEPGGVARATSNGKVEFRAGGLTIRCELVLTLWLAEVAIRAVENESFGSVTGVEIRNCEGGRVAAVLGLEWPIHYIAPVGELPNALTGVLIGIQGAAFNFAVFGGLVNCLYIGNAAAELELNGRNPYRTGTLAFVVSAFTFVRGGGACPREGGFQGSFELAPAQEVLFREP